ncbi:AAA family ATPase [Ramlibacter monticola]|uniref:AAA family ATPase n=1 Tax=Ramlibacter monticola TaxID=1926872 RepID=A0A936Z410_9BURK|nr:AAA family ATPase [Ramlibacter monticola]MBL0394658.1 AAA family ATPase [Ramlibacter monticola]
MQDPTPAAGWILALSRSPSGLTCFLTDGLGRFEHADCPWPPPSSHAGLPASVLQAVAQSSAGALRLQLDEAVDDWPWEAELEGARAGLQVARYVRSTDNAAPGAAEKGLGSLGASSRTDPLWCHGAPPGPAGRVAMAGAQGVAVMVVSDAVSAEQAAGFRAALLRRWGPEPRFSAAAVLAAQDCGLSRDQWRLYGDAWFAPAQPEDEKRPVTSMNIDLVDSTRLLQAWGDENYAQAHGAFYQLCRRIVVEEHHGRLDQDQGDDGLMAYFGLEHAREDSAATAVRAGWALAAEVTRIGLEVRIGIATGQVAVQRGLAFSEYIHLAARLQHLASPNGIIVSAATHALLGPGVVCELLPGKLVVKGFAEPQVAYRVVSLPSPHAARWLPAGQARFVGRQRELSALREAWFVARANRRGQYHCLLGEPGIGKTRLLHEFERELRRGAEQVTVLHIAGYEEMQSSAFATLALAAEHAGLQEIAALLQPPRASEGGAAPDEPFDRNELLERLAAACLQVARRAPICVLVDDAQWLDPSTIEFVERLRSRAATTPLLLVVSLREDARGMVRGFDTEGALTLQALDLHESLDLIGALSAAAPLAPGVRSFIAERAAGIPLFLEETVRMVAQLESDSSEAVHGIPATLQGLLAARLDRLGPARRMAQLAAVLGAEFPVSLWEEVLADADSWIQSARTPGARQRLMDAGVLVGVAGDGGRCRFRHALIRDAAYRSLWERDQKHLHGVVARILEHHPLNDGGALRAHHLSAAGEFESAVAAWAEAARGAAAAGADREALVLSQHALALLQKLPATPALQQQALQLHLLQAARCIALDGYGAASVESAYLRAAALCNEAEAGTMRIRVDLGLEACYAMRGDLPRARALAESAVNNTPWEGNLRLALQARWAWANVVFHQGDLVSSLDMAEQCLARYETTLHYPSAVQDPAILLLCYSAWGLFQQGSADEARRRIQRALALADTLEHPFSLAIAHGFAASVAMFCGEHAEGLRHAEEAIRRCRAKAFQAWLAHAQVMRGRLRAALGETRAGLQDMEEGFRLWTETGARITAATYLALQAEVRLDLGQPELALDKLTLAQEIATRHGERYYEAELLRLRGCAQWRLRRNAARAAAAQDLLQQALALAREQGNLGFALRSAVALGRTWAERGEAARAAALVRDAMQAVPGHRSTLDLRTARALHQEWVGSGAEQEHERD